MCGEGVWSSVGTGVCGEGCGHQGALGVNEGVVTVVSIIYR